MHFLTVALVCVACGGRSALATRDGGSGGAPGTPPANGCKDALEPGAFAPVDRFCSDRSRRSPVVAPAHPHVVWTRTFPKDDVWELVVDASGDAIVIGERQNKTPYAESVWAFDRAGDELWTATPQSPPAAWLTRAVLRGDGAIDLADYTWDPTAPPYQSSNSYVLSSSGASETAGAWLPTMGDILVSPDGAIYVEQILADIYGWSFLGVARMASNGTPVWEDRGASESAGDVPAPYAFALRGNHLLLAANAHDATVVHVHEVDENDVTVFDTDVDGRLASDVVVAPDGRAEFLVALPPYATSNLEQVEIAQNGASATHPLGLQSGDDWPTKAAVARDGTFVSFASTGLVAISDGTVRWQAPIADLGTHTDLLVDPATTVVVATSGSARGFDLATGLPLWSCTVPEGGAMRVAPAGPRALYVQSDHSLVLLSD